MKKFLVMISLLSSFSAFADQCAWNSLSDSKSAKSLIKDNDIILWCQACSEARPSNIFKVVDIDVSKPANGNELSVVLSNQTVESLDLAYTYVRTSSDIFANVAQLVGCPSEGATTFIQTGKGKKKTAHFYDKKGVRKDVKMVDGEIQFAEFKAMNLSNRMPASKK